MINDPVKNLRALKLKENMLVADVGSGTGFYTLPLARILVKGRVYAIDVQKDFLDTIRRKAENDHIDNIDYIWGNVENIGGTKLKDQTVDAVIISNILFQVEHRTNFINEVKRILKTGGELLLIDWADTSSPFVTRGHKIITKDEARGMFEQSGFVFHKDIDPGDHHYGIILVKINE